MRISILVMIMMLVVSCATRPTEKMAEGLQIIELVPDKRTALVTQNLLQLHQIYELEPLLFTREIRVTSSPLPTPPESGILLDTRYSDEPNKLLASWLHELMRFWLNTKSERLAPVVTELHRQFPALRTPGQQEKRTLQLVACFLEYKALSHFLGEKEARAIVQEFIRTDKHFPWSYTQVLEKGKLIEKALEKSLRLPAPLG
jgi:hypothetical protein